MLDLEAPLKTEEVSAFRSRVRDFISRSLPEDLRLQGEAERMDIAKEDQRTWHKLLYSAKLACPSWPSKFGGPELSDAQCYVLERELALAGAPRPMIYGTTMIGPTLIRHGTPEQQIEFLPDILHGNTFWCEGFSEANAGSDLASLRCSAKLREDEYVINGHKMWTSEGHIADWMFGLFRTETTSRKQEGITFLMLDMSSPGINVRPIKTFDGTGVEINQVFFDDVHVPISQRVGLDGNGWTIAKDLLSTERFGNAEISRSMATLKRLRKFCNRKQPDGSRIINETHVARLLADLHIELAAIEQTELRILMQGASAGAEAALLKLRGTEIQNRILSSFTDLLGPYVIADLGQLDARPIADVGPPETRYLLRNHLNYRKTMIYGGSNEIQRNILAKAVLGL